MKKIRVLSLVLVLLSSNVYADGLTKSLVINEVMQSVISGSFDQLHEYPDSWVELYNPSGKEITLTGYRIGKSSDIAECYKIEQYGGWGWGWGGGLDAKIKSKSYIVICCDKENRIENGEIHTNFRLTNNKEGAVYLFDPNGQMVDSLHLPSMPAPDVAYGRKADGSDEVGYMLVPTRGSKNKGGLAQSVLPDPVFSTESRVVEAEAGAENSIPVGISLPEDAPDGAVIRYTLDGYEPNPYSTEYTGPISITGNTTVKAALFLTGHVTPPAATRVFIFHGRRLTLPVVSLITRSTDLYGDNGIITNNKSSDQKVNWRRPALVDYFPAGEEVSDLQQLCEIRVSGAYARGNDQKSLVVYANSRFGSKDYLKAKFWPYSNPDMKKSPSIVLRNAGNDFNYGHMRDGISHMLFGLNTDVDWQGFQPAAVYLNGEYYGIQNIRERSNEDNVWMHYDKLEDITMLENPYWGAEGALKCGDVNQYYELDNFLKDDERNRKRKYSEYKARVDVEEYTNVMIANIYMSNTDFPGNNHVLWRPMENGGKWRWFLKDIDRSFNFFYKHHGKDEKGYENGRSYAQYLRWVLRDPDNIFENNYEGANSPDATRLLRNLMRFDDYKKMFIDRFTVYLGDFLRSDYINSLMDWAQHEMSVEMQYHKKLYGGTVSDWSREIADMKNWATERTENMYEQLQDYFKLGSMIPAYINTSEDNPENYDITVNDIPLSTHQFDGYLFSGRKYQLHAESSDSGYDVAGWEMTTYYDDGTDETTSFSGKNTVVNLGRNVECVELNILRTANDTGFIGNDVRKPVKVIYYNVDGVASDKPFAGVNLVRSIYSDGSYKVSKILDPVR